MRLHNLKGLKTLMVVHDVSQRRLAWGTRLQLRNAGTLKSHRMAGG